MVNLDMGKSPTKNKTQMIGGSPVKSPKKTNRNVVGLISGINTERCVEDGNESKGLL